MGARGCRGGAVDSLVDHDHVAPGVSLDLGADVLAEDPREESVRVSADDDL